MSKQDRQGVRTATDLERKYDLASLVGVKRAVENNVEGLNKTNTMLEEFMTSTLGTINELQSQIDGNITTWFYSGVPTLSNLPASEWTTDELKNNHLGDTYYDQDTGFAYRFGLCDGEYKWITILDNDVAEALAVANEAKDTADGKRRVFTDTPTVPYDEGDLWIVDDELYVCHTTKESGTFSAGDFRKATKYTDDTELNNFVNVTYAESMKSLTSLVDSKITTWYYAGVPTLSNLPASGWTTSELKASHVGDLYYDKDTGHTYIFNANHAWEQIVDSDLAEALALANSASDTADSKRRIFTSQPVPPYDNGDLWFKDGEIYICQVSKAYSPNLLVNYSNVRIPTQGVGATDYEYQVIYTEFERDVDYTFSIGRSEVIEGDFTTYSVLLYNFTNSTHFSGGLVNVSDTRYSFTFNIPSEYSNDYIRLLVYAGPAGSALNNAILLDELQLEKGSVATEFKPYSGFETKDFIVATKYTDDTLATQVGDNLEVVRGTVTTIKEGVDAFKIEMETTVKTIDSLQQETIESVERMSYTFGTNDLTIAKSTDPVNTRINNQGLKVYTYNELQAIFNHRGAGIQKLIVVGDTQLGNISIVKATDENGNPCTDINYLVSNVQDLHDLEGGE